MPGGRASSSAMLPVLSAPFGCSACAIAAPQPPSGSLDLRPHLRGGLDHLVDVALHVERLLRQVIMLARDDLLEGADRVRELHVPALDARELLRHEEGLREELLDLAGALDEDL